MKIDFRDGIHNSRHVTYIEITWDDGTFEEHSDNGDPEDNYFHADWDWVDRALDRAYREGFQAGKNS